MPVRIVTDSTSDLSPKLARSLGITVVPLNVHFGETVYRDGVDISAQQFYERLPRSIALPTTSQPSGGAFAEAYKRLAAGADGIVSIHISAKLSGTCNSALLGVQEARASCPVEVVDSQLASMALGLVALGAARAAQEGQSMQQVAEVARSLIPRVKVFFVIETFEYLQRGGRIGRAQAFLGSLLQVKPILTLKDGEVVPLERVRSRPKALERLRQLVRERSSVQELAVMHSASPQDAEALARDLAPLVPRERLHVATLGPVIGTHVGPGVVGIALVEAQ